MQSRPSRSARAPRKAPRQRPGPRLNPRPPPRRQWKKSDSATNTQLGKPGDYCGESALPIGQGAVIANCPTAGNYGFSIVAEQSSDSGFGNEISYTVEVLGSNHQALSKDYIMLSNGDWISSHSGTYKVVPGNLGVSFTIDGKVCTCAQQDNPSSSSVGKVSTATPSLPQFKFVTLHQGTRANVSIPNDIQLQNTPVTQRQWVDVMLDNPSAFNDRKYCPKSFTQTLGQRGETITLCPDLPVENVKWSEANAFVDLLNQLSNQTCQKNHPSDGCDVYFLPSVNTYHFVQTNRPPFQEIQNYAWVHENSWASESSEYQPHPVGTKRPDAWGLFDIYGNVPEWTSSAADEQVDSGRSDSWGRTVYFGIGFHYVKAGDFEDGGVNFYDDGDSPILKYLSARSDDSHGTGLRLVRQKHPLQQ